MHILIKNPILTEYKIKIKKKINNIIVKIVSNLQKIIFQNISKIMHHILTYEEKNEGIS